MYFRLTEQSDNMLGCRSRFAVCVISFQFIQLGYILTFSHPMWFVSIQMFFSRNSVLKDGSLHRITLVLAAPTHTPPYALSIPKCEAT